MMRNIQCLLLVFTLTFTISHAQVGINTTNPDAGSILDITSEDKGVLLPRVNIADLSTISPVSGSTTEGLLVYNINETTGKGLHVWSGSEWLPLANSSEAWSINGNSGTDSSNFLGTTDNTSLNFKVNNFPYMALYTDGYLTGSPNQGKLTVGHIGSAGSAAAFRSFTSSNSSPTMRVTSQGTGAAVLGENSNSNITGIISVGDFSYTGTDADNHIGVSGSSAPAAGLGIGVQGTGNQYGVLSIGNSHTEGNSSATGTKSFIIDHPLEPDNKLLKHFSVESDEVLNLYRGVVVLNSSGEAEVVLPEYFSEINKNISYQLTSIGTPTQAFVEKEIEGNTFTIGGEPGKKVSWMILSERNDSYLRQHPEARETEVFKDSRVQSADHDSH